VGALLGMVVSLVAWPGVAGGCVPVSKWLIPRWAAAEVVTTHNARKNPHPQFR